MAMTSEAGVMLNPSCRGYTIIHTPNPTTTFRKVRSLRSITLSRRSSWGLYEVRPPFLQVVIRSWRKAGYWLFQIAGKITGKMRLISSTGITCESRAPNRQPRLHTPKPVRSEGSQHSHGPFTNEVQTHRSTQWS